MSARVIFVIRHGEKPPLLPPPSGVELDGTHDEHSLLPLGWQRAGALATLFAPYDGHLREGLAAPDELISPQYPKGIATHRTYETIYPLSQLVGVAIANPYPEGAEARLAQTLAAATKGVTLVCWEHHAIQKIAENIMPDTTFPKWPADRFDVVWSFVRVSSSPGYVFSQVPQMLLAGDRDTAIKITAV